MKTWYPETLIDAQPLHDEQLVEHSRQQKQKQSINFDYVYCIGGDGTLLRLLHILFSWPALPDVLPRIITMSSGSLNYLSNFQMSEYREILAETALHLDQACIS